MTKPQERTPPVPHSDSDLTSSWISVALGIDVEVISAQRFGAGVGLVSEMYRVATRERATGERRIYIAKLSSTQPETRALNIGYRMYEREVRFFSELAPSTDVRTPRCYYAGWDAGSGDSVLLMEDLSAMRTPDQAVGATEDEARAALSELARLHADWWGRPEIAQCTWLGSLDEPTYSEGIVAGYEMLWPVARERFAGLLSPATRALGDRLAPHIRPIQQRLFGDPTTLAHGDFRIENLMFATEPDQPPVVVVDWQAVVRARGTQELGYFIGQSLTPEDRRRLERDLVTHYAECLATNGVEGFGFEQCWEDYRYSLVYAFAYGAIMAGLDASDEAAQAKVGMVLARVATAVEDLDAARLLD